MQKYIFLSFKYHIKIRNHFFSKTPLPVYIFHSLYYSGHRKQNPLWLTLLCWENYKSHCSLSLIPLRPVLGPLHMSLVINLAKALPETGHFLAPKPHMTLHCLNLTRHSMPSPTWTPQTNQACLLSWPAMNLALSLMPCSPVSTNLIIAPPHHLISKQAFNPQLEFSFIQRLSRLSVLHKFSSKFLQDMFLFGLYLYVPKKDVFHTSKYYIVCICVYVYIHICVLYIYIYDYILHQT